MDLSDTNGTLVYEGLVINILRPTERYELRQFLSHLLV